METKLYLITKTPLHTGAMSAVPYSSHIEGLFKFITKYGDEVNMSVVQGGLLYIPRRAAPLGEVDYRTVNEIPAIDCKMPPRTQEQAEMIKKSVALLTAGEDHIAQAPTGFGKTYIGGSVAVGMRQKTIILVTKEDLMGSWYDALTQLIGIPPEKIGKIQQNVCDYKDKWFVIAMVHSLVGNENYPAEMYKDFGLAIFDETHRMAADTFVLACHKLPTKYRLGLSATPTRGDGKTRILELHIGPIAVVGHTVPMKAKILVQKTGWKVPTVARKVGGIWKQVPIPHSAGRMMAVNKAIGASSNRNALIGDFCRQAYDAGRTTLVVSDLIDDHLKILFHVIAGKGIPAEEIGFYISGKKPHELKAQAHRRVILATYGMVSEGTDYPHWDTLVLATPRANVTQTLGRILRQKPDKKQPVCLDLVDDGNIFSGYYQSREKQYYQVKSEVVKL